MFTSKKLFSLSLLLFPTLIIFSISLFFASLIRQNQIVTKEFFFTHLTLFLLHYILWLFIFYGSGLFDLSKHKSFSQISFELVKALSVCGFLSVSLFYLFTSSNFSPKSILLLHLLLNYVFVLFWQILIRTIFVNQTKEEFYFFGSRNSFEKLMQEFEKNKQSHFPILFIENPELIKIKKHHYITIILEDSSLASSNIQQWITLHENGVTFISLHTFYEQIFQKIDLFVVTDWWILKNIHQSQEGFKHFSKRCVDLFFGFLMMVVFLMTFPILSILIKLTSKGPIFFLQTRTGYQNKSFTLIKYRTMKTDAPHDQWTKTNDQRITRIGNVLRKTRLDELPQCFNLLLGHLSFVGPRPEQEKIVKQLEGEIPYYHSRHMVSPGLTGWAQLHIYASSIEETREKLAYDLYYIKHQSLFFDVKIVIKTIFHLINLKGR